MKRVVTAAVGISLVVLLVSFAPAWAFGVVVAVLAGAGFAELARLAGAPGVTVPAAPGVVATALVAMGPVLPPAVRNALGPLGLLTLVSLALLLWTLSPRRPLSQAMPVAGALLLGVLWIGLMSSHLTALRLLPAPGGQGGWLYTLFLGVWGNDSGAMYAGKLFGKRKLAPRLSPGKTVAGLVGGTITCVVGVLLGVALFELGDRLPWPRAVLLALIVAVACNVGDLVESAFKRGAGVKDSGAFLPGHGGVLDRVDSLLFAAPVMYHYLSWPHAL